MQTERFDFNEIVDQLHFLQQFCERFALDTRSGISDLEMLRQVIMTVTLPVPLTIEFINLGLGQKKRYDALILLLGEMKTKLGGQLYFSIK